MIGLKALIKSLDCLVLELREDREQREQERGWTKAICGLATQINLQQMEQRIMKELDELETEVGEVKTVVQSAIVLINGIADRINKAGVDPVKLKALTDSLNTDGEALAAAVAANTPAEE